MWLLTHMRLEGDLVLFRFNLSSPLRFIFTIHQLRKEQASLNVIRLEPWVPLKDGLLVIPSPKHGQDVFYGQPTSANNWLTTEDTPNNYDPI